MKPANDTVKTQTFKKEAWPNGGTKRPCFRFIQESTQNDSLNNEVIAVVIKYNIFTIIQSRKFRISAGKQF